ncbi:hypothetical protein SDC9_176402 [bioreactor metagenome]|uniref:Uncharacterized protein n=1 Tax=bioreactor metagenome TaxID=1076179 RepID=A0A645GRW2_9ZZZZ
MEIYERLKNTNGSWQTDAAGNAVYRKRPNSFNLKVSELSTLSGTLYLCPVKDSGSKRDIKLELSYTAPLGGKTHKDTVQLTNLHLDVDVDSNNDGTVSTDDRTEDDIETTAPGKVVLLNTSDRDGDGVVDRYDWEISGNGFNEPLFEELHLNLPDSIDLTNYKVGVSYAAAAPPLPGDAN